MPLYEYYCAECRGKFELLVSFEASNADVVCTRCHGTSVRKLISVFARPVRGGGDNFGDLGDDGDEYGSEYGADDGEDFGGGCSCGGNCTCGN